ncbi:zinc finger BED domain-containing protein 4-like [Diachasma alloeum]|uniref:zinc finger BED domain-containing protein 4-like n=1 Tax=Diachasma alloeum TaxID=454923 RepID=UPI00073821A6|nr:zinc finger BED domain-containing protein 4-like [Diachasma alloeum]
MLSKEEIAILKDLVQLMEPIESGIINISGSRYATCSVVIPLVRGIVSVIKKLSPETGPAKQFQEALLTRIMDKFRDVELMPLLGQATLLDPRFKKVAFEKPLAVTTHLQRIDKLLKDASKQENLKSKENVEVNIRRMAPSLWDLHDELVAKQAPEEEDQGYHSELRQYLKGKVISREEDPFQEWEKLKPAYATLYPIAIKYLSIIATSVPSERIFSQAGKIKDDDRSRLTGENLNKLLFLGSLNREEWGL